ncbi:MAG TPA: hypothetical protein VJS68_03000, partial [Thermoplasmata archaeon]|nr:hypothetical protein [Thermoplasmata archaeon]
MRRGVDRPGVALYLFPAVIGRGRGDVEEVLALGRALDRSGFFPILFRSRGRPLPTGVDSTFEWPRHLRRTDRPITPPPRAAVIASWWGVTSAPRSAGPLGNPGPWAEEWAELERAYGPEHLLGISVEEFARTLSCRQQVSERWREGGWPAARIARQLVTPAGRAEVKSFHRLYGRFRAFGSPNVLHLFPTLGPSRRFWQEHP